MAQLLFEVPRAQNALPSSAAFASPRGAAAAHGIFEDGLEYYHDLSYDAARKRWEDMPEWRKYEIIAQKRAEWMRRLDEIERRLAELQGRPYDPNFLRNDPELQQWIQDDVGMDKDSESSDS